MALTNKQEIFISEYLKSWNATKAAIAAGYSERTAYSIGSELLKKPEIASHVRERIEANAMTANEVLGRLAAHARGDIMDLVDPHTFTLDWDKAKERGATNLVKKVKQTIINNEKTEQQTEIFEFEMYDAQAALVHIGKQLGLFVSKTEVTGKDGEPLAIQINRVTSRIESPNADD